MSRLLILPYHVKESKKTSFTSEDILEELIDILSTFPSIHTSSKSTSKYLFINPVPFNELKKTYHINFLIEGGIKIVNEEFVISSRLISTENDNILFKWKYSFEPNELTSVLQKIAFKTHKLITSNPKSIEEDKNKAQEYYLTGLRHWKKYTHEELKIAIKHFKNSIKYNKSFALAYAAIADCYCVIGVMGFEDPKNSFTTAKYYVQNAFSLNNKRSETFVSAALIDMFQDRDYNQANTNLIQALLLNKNNVKVHHAYAMYYIHVNDFLLAEKHALINIKNAPLETPHYHIIAQIYLYKKEFKKGLDYIEKALEIDPNSIEIKELEGHLNMHLNHFEKAIDCYQTCLYKKPNDCIYYSNLAYAFSKSNYHIDSRKVTEDMNKLKTTLNNSSKFNYALSIIKLGQLQYDDFFKHINIALNKGLGMFIGELIGNPIYNEVRKDKRFTLLLKKLNLDSFSKKNQKNKFPASIITITTKTKEKLTLDPQNIAYIESHGNYAKIFWFEQNILKNKLLRISLSDFEQQLSKVTYIHRCHKSYIINTNETLAISGNSKNYFFESNYYPIRIPISRSKSSYFLKLINDDK